MGWKLRKDKMKAEEPPSDAAPPEEMAHADAVVVALPPEPHEFADAPPEPHELTAVPVEDEADLTPLPTWDSPTFVDAPQTAEAEQPAPAHYETIPVPEDISPESETHAAAFDAHPAEALAFDAADDLTFDDDAEAAPVAAAGPSYADAPALGSVYALEPEAASGPIYDDAPEPMPGPAHAYEPEPGEVTPEPLLLARPAPDPDTIAPALVTTETDSGLPRVAPFILDAPSTPEGPTMEDETRHLILRLGNLSATFPLVKDVTVIGRPDSKLHYYPDIEIELDDAVSRRHAEIIRRNGQYYVVDAGSTNGTLLNGETLVAHEEQALMHGDRIRLGERAEIIFE